jgi:hypothetical protein
MGRKVSDKFTVSICRLHHRCTVVATSAPGGKTRRIEPLAVAATLWAKSHAVAPAEAEIVDDRDRSYQLKAQRTSF